MRWTLALVGFLTISARAADPKGLPEVPPGWKIAIVAEAPKILFPTAIVAAPDGTVYLGQDPMDMPGPPTKPIDSVVAIKDGKVSVFADNLWSVMGLEWIDGTLYVVHAPFLSAFTDTDGDGKADKRVDLMTGLGPKLPGFSGINDHVPSGIRLGMDGFLYLSFGDKGIPDGVGKDGTRIRVEGGGVIRIRPDGTGLEVVSTGERNPLSVALSATDEVFTYGNDDDSKKWPNSLTHHIVGAHFGYPYQFLNAPKRTLPILTGQLGGSGTQGICYNEDGLPADYRGDLFFCDWGLQEVFRYKVEKAGGTYKLVKKSSFIKRGAVPDFRPFSVATSYDGTTLYVVDWAFAGWLASGPQTGRLYRMTYEGPDKVHPAARPTGQDLPSRVAALDHPALAARMKAQRDLIKVGPDAVAPLIERFGKTNRPRPGRLHALWTLDAITAPETRNAVRVASRVGLSDEDAEIRLHAAKVAGIRKDVEAVSSIASLLKDPDAAVRREAAIALGKIGGPTAIAGLMTALGDPDRFAEWSIEHAIRRLKAWDTSELTAALLDPKRRDAALDLTDEAWSVAVIDALIAAFEKTDDTKIRARIVANLAGLHRRYPEWSGNWFGTNPLAGEFPRKTRPWSPEGMIRVIVGLTRALGDADTSVRKAAIAGLAETGPPAAAPFRARLDAETDPANQAALASALGQLHDPAATPTLARWLKDGARPLPVRSAALDALAQIPGRPAAVARLGVLYDKTAPPELLARALPALGQARIVPPNDLASFLEHTTPAVRVAAIASLSYRSPAPPEAKAAILARFADPAPEVRKTAVEAAGTLKIREAIPKLLPLVKNDATRSEATLALCALPDPRALPVYLEAIADRSPEVRRAGENALLAIRDLVGGDLEKGIREKRFNNVAYEAVERVLTRFTPIPVWKVIGPFPRTTAQVFVGEKSIDFRRQHSGVEGRTIAWADRSAQEGTGRLIVDDFKAGTGDKGGFGYDTNGSPDLASFAYAEIPADKERAAMLLIGSSGSLIVTLNEQVILNYSNFAGRPYSPDSDRLRVVLRKGKNRLLIRSRQGIGSWSFGVQVSDPAETLFATRPGSTSLADLRDHGLRHDGDPIKGRAIFFDPKGIGCVKCHAAGGMGVANVGPDLTGLSLKYDRAEIIRSVLEPSNRLATGYQPVLVAKTDGKVITGLLRAETADYLDLIDSDAKLARVAKADIDERRVGDVSLMPTGLVDTLSKEEFADLIAYLRSLKATPATR
ncbi:MAG: putative heme-binding protein [Planctomycetota bacterium]|nr:putative heme-binding protein [Planctomycetota bacterium]